MGLIYAVKNKVNDKYYIGQTIQKWPKRKLEHIYRPINGSAIDRAIQKYGTKNFEWKILIQNIDNQYKLNSLEKFWILQLKTRTFQWGYNIKEGGTNGKHSKETIQKIRKLQKGENHPRYGKKHSIETKRRISKNHADLSGNNHPMHGKHHSKETRKRLSEVNKGKKHPKFGKYKKYPGTYYRKDRNPEKRPWQCGITFNGKRKTLGHYEDPITSVMIFKYVQNEIYS